jgi:hypothetical protein
MCSIIDGNNGTIWKRQSRKKRHRGRFKGVLTNESRSLWKERFTYMSFSNHTSRRKRMASSITVQAQTCTVPKARGVKTMRKMMPHSMTMLQIDRGILWNVEIGNLKLEIGNLAFMLLYCFR